MTDQHAFKTLIDTYADALRDADAGAVAALYTSDGVLMAPEAPSVVGADAVARAYAGMFGAIGLDIAFTIAECRELTPDWAFARTTSAGTITLRATGAALPEANQELFLFERRHGAWKIARYSFSSTLRAQPAAGELPQADPSPASGSRQAPAIP